MPPSFPTCLADPSRRIGTLCRAGAFVAWVVFVLMGFSALLAYEMTPGRSVVSPPAAAGTNDARGSGEVTAEIGTGYTLVMAAHPPCPCTRASLAELALLMTRRDGRLAATVWFYTPDNEAADWAHTGLWKTAAALPGVTARVDPEGKTAGLLGAETSGQVLLFDPAGRRVFAGGITGARGHEGDNAGLRAVEALVLGQTTAPVTTPVFGCSILDAPAEGTLAAANTSAEGPGR